MRRVEFLRREITKKRSIRHQVGMVLAGVAFAALVRIVLDQGKLGVPFVTYAPTILLISIMLGWRMGGLAAMLSLLSIALFFHLVPAGSTGDSPLVVLVALGISSAALIYIGDIMHVAIRAIDEQRRKFETFNAELQHRSGNALQIIQAFAMQAARSPEPQSSIKDLTGRISAMATANRLLGPGEQQACDLRELISKSLDPFPRQRITLQGPSCRITGKSGVRLVMALHELATNAVKYGALSSELGAVDIGWQVVDEAIEIRWKETGGPPVKPPVRQGLGSAILKAADGLSKVKVEFEPQGVVCRIRADAEVCRSGNHGASPCCRPTAAHACVKAR